MIGATAQLMHSLINTALSGQHSFIRSALCNSAGVETIALGLEYCE